MEQKIHQKVALVTGSSKGIGKAVALRLGLDGYHVCVTYFTDQEGGKNTEEEIKKCGGNATLYHLDVRDEKSVISVISDIKSKFGHLDLLVNNAVKELSKPLVDATFDEWKIVLSTKVDGAFLLTKYSIPLLTQGVNPNVIMISTFEGEKPNPEFLAYGVANAAIIAFTKAMASYLTKFGIRINAISPGEVRTPLWGDLMNDESLWNDLAKSNPMGRVATVEDVADAVMILVNDPHRFLNGNFLYVNGGNHLRI